MPRAVVTIVVAFALLLLAPPAAGQAATNVRFDAPAQAGNHLTLLDATWLLIVLGPEGTGGVSLVFPNPVEDRNITVASLRTLAGHFTIPAESTRVLSGFSADASFPDGVASLYLEGDRLRVVAESAHASLLPRVEDGCLDRLLPHAEMAGDEARYFDLCPPDLGVAAVLRPQAAAMPVRVEAEGLRIVEYHHVALSCKGEPDCPGEGSRVAHDDDPLGQGLSSRILGYNRLASNDATASGSAQAQLVLAGGTAFDVGVQGWMRLPLASLAGPCAACGSPGRQTLYAEGNLTLEGLRAEPDGRLAAGLRGTVRHARIDERGIDPSLLLGLGIAGASLATAAASALAVRVLASFFSRIPQEESLDHPRRRLLMDAIRQNPGIHVRALARLAGTRATLAQYHVDVLLRNGHAVARRQGRRTCLFENHGRYGDEWQVLALLRDPALGRLHGWIGATPGTSRLAVVLHAVRAWGWSRRTAYHRLGRLERAGLVRWAGDEGASEGGLQALGALPAGGEGAAQAGPATGPGSRSPW